MTRTIYTEKPLVVGLTGQTGAGKTTVSQTFMENGFYVIDGDAVARILTTKGHPYLDEVSRHFGKDVLDADGNLIRQKLADIVFTDPQKLQELNAVFSPYVVAQIKKMVDSATTFCSRRVLIDAPTLFETGCNRLCSKVVSVVSDRELRLRRIIARDGLTRSQAENRVKAQLSEEFFRAHSDYVIENNTSREDLQLRALDVVSKIIL